MHRAGLVWHDMNTRLPLMKYSLLTLATLLLALPDSSSAESPQTAVATSQLKVPAYLMTL